MQCYALSRVKYCVTLSLKVLFVSVAMSHGSVFDSQRPGFSLHLLLQGGVYNLVDKDGNVDKKRVLKAKHRHALLAKVIPAHLFMQMRSVTWVLRISE